MTAKQAPGCLQAPDGSYYVTLTDGNGNLASAGGSSGITIGTTAITGGATTQVLFNLSGKVQSDSGFTYAGSNGQVTITSGALPSSPELFITGRSTPINTTAPALSINASTIPTGLQTYHGGGVNTPFDVVVAPTVTGSNWSGISVIGVGDGAIANIGSTTTYPYLEFAKSGGTLSAPTDVSTSWLLGEIAVVNRAGGAYNYSTLIDFTSAVGGANFGQINFVLVGSSAGNQAAPNYSFTQAAAYLGGIPAASITPYIILGNNTTKSSLTTAGSLQISSTSGRNQAVNLVRGSGGSADYYYFGVTPEVTLDATHVHWGSGLYSGDYNWTLWNYNGTVNTKVLIFTPNGGGNIATISGSLQFGLPNVNGAPTAQTLTFQGALAGSATNQASTNTTIIGSLGTGTGTNGDLIFQIGVKGSTGTAQATATTALTIKGETGQLITIFSPYINKSGTSAITTNATTFDIFVNDSNTFTSGNIALQITQNNTPPYVSVQNGFVFGFNSGTGVPDTILARGATGIFQFSSTQSFTANATTATAITSVGPAGANTTVQEWLTIKNSSGVTRYIPCF